MKDYLNADERNQLMVLMSILQVMDGVRNNTGLKNPAEMQSMIEDWEKRGNLTKEEHRSLSMAKTYLEKFCKSVFNRMNSKEKESFQKKLCKFDFRLVDDFTLQKIYREMQDKMKNAVVPRDEFQDWTEQIMECNCKNCKKHWEECRLHEIFEDNFIPESTRPLENCKYAYQVNEKGNMVLSKKEQKRVKKIRDTIQRNKNKKAKKVV